VLLGKTLLVKLLGMKQPGVSKMKKLKNFLKDSGLVAVLVVAPHSMASELTVPNQFSSGDVTSASDVNANFAAIEAAVNDNHARIQEGLQSQSRPVFVGLSEPVSGTNMHDYQQACHALLAQSHVCTSIELALAPLNPDVPIPNEKAWIFRETWNESSTITGCPITGNPTIIENGNLYSDGGTCWGSSFPVACCK
jgi:hypothetical protein